MENSQYWLDSHFTLGWIRRNPNRWKPFVRNHVETVRKFPKSSWWRHDLGLKNPVDLASWREPAQALVEWQLWWKGPAWLKEGESKWPNSPEENDTKEIQQIEHEATGKVINVSLAIEVNRQFEWNIERISSWNRLLRPGSFDSSTDVESWTVIQE